MRVGDGDRVPPGAVGGESGLGLQSVEETCTPLSANPPLPPAGRAGPAGRSRLRRVAGAGRRRLAGPRRTAWRPPAPGTRANGPAQCRPTPATTTPRPAAGHADRGGRIEADLEHHVAAQVAEGRPAGAPRENHPVGQHGAIQTRRRLDEGTQAGVHEGLATGEEHLATALGHELLEHRGGNGGVEAAGRGLRGGLGAAVPAGQVAVEVGVDPQPAAHRRPLTPGEDRAASVILAASAVLPALRTANHHGPSADSATCATTSCPARSAQAGRSATTLASALRTPRTCPGPSRLIARVIRSSRPLPQSMSPPSIRASTSPRGFGTRSGSVSSTMASP